MNNLSKELIKHFFIKYPRLDFLFQSEFSKKHILPAEKGAIFSETTAFIRLLPAFAYKEGIDPFGKPLPAALITKALKQFNPFAWRAALQNFSGKEQTAVVAAEQFGLPCFFVEKLYNTYSPDFVETFLKRSVMERPLYLRKIGDKEWLDPSIIPVAGIPGAYQFTGPVLDFSAPWYKEGLFTVQDLSGQLACLLINPKPGQKVLDACAGNGGKTVVLADLMQGKGAVFALHQTRSEFAELKQRLRCHNLQNVRQVLAGPDMNWGTVFDIILTDVPCSGSGVIRRNPDLIYRLQSLDWEKFPVNQLSILKAFSRFLKPGGKLVYTTCSVMALENAQVIAAFLNENNDRFAPGGFISGREYYKLNLPTAAQTLGGSPEVNCDGFFLADLTPIG